MTRGIAVFGLLVALGFEAHASTLSDLGYHNGLTLQGPAAGAEVYFPLPPGGASAHLVLDLSSSPMLDRYSSMTVTVGGEVLASLPLKSETPTVDLKIPEHLLRSGGVGVRFAADLAMRRDEPCFDNNTPSVWMRLGPQTRVETEVSGGGGIGEVWRSFAGEVAIAMQAAPSRADLETAVTLAVALTRRGAQPHAVGINDPSADILIAPGLKAMEVVPSMHAGHAPVLRIATPAASRAVVSGGSLLAGTKMADAAAAPAGANPVGTAAITLAEIGIHPANVAISGASTISLALPFSQIPNGRHPTSLQLFGHGATLPEGETLIAAATVGPPEAGQLVWSRTFRGEVDLDGETIPIPPAKLQNNTGVTLVLVRAGHKPACGGNDTLAFQLRDTSRLLLADGATPARSFGGFAVPSDAGALLRVDAAPAAAVPFIGLMARMLADAGVRPGAITVADNQAALDRPFIVIAPTAPAAIATSATVRPDLGHVVIARPADGLRLEIAGVDAMTVLQVVQTDRGVSGIWLSPGRVTPPSRLDGLGAGNVAAFVAADAPPAVFDTLDPMVQVESPHDETLSAFLERWRIELFVLAWIVATWAAVGVVIRLRRPTSRP